MRNLSSAPWPGNVRQLRNEVMRLAACSRAEPPSPKTTCGRASHARARPAAPAKPVKAQSLKKAVAELEQRMIAEALQATRNNQQQAARQLGLSRQGLINKMKRYSLAG